MAAYASISPIKVQLPPAKGLFLVRSKQQIWTIAGGAIGLIVVSLIGLALISPEAPGFRGAIIGTAAGAMIGMIVVLANSFQAEFRWSLQTPAELGQALAILRRGVRAIGYATEHSPSLFYKYADAPFTLTFEHIRIDYRAGEIVVCGPWEPLRKLRRRLLREAKAGWAQANHQLDRPGAERGLETS